MSQNFVSQNLVNQDIVIVGAGHGGAQAAASLRDEGHQGAITLLGAEAAWPYQRPPLSKAFLKGAMDEGGLPLRGQEFFREHAIDLRLGVGATRIDRAARRVHAADGWFIGYDNLILATGARNRVPPIVGIERAGVFFLRNIADAKGIKRRLHGAERVVVIGAGFIGLEIAATARALGKATTVVEVADRPMSRALSNPMSAFFRRAHEGFGATFRFGVGASEIGGGLDGRAAFVTLSDGARLDADLVIVGAGVLAEDALAAEAGLMCKNGIVVDAHLRTSDERIFALGDCAAFPDPTGLGHIRLESVQNAVDQARAIARTVVGKGEPYRALPWFWSDQGDLKLQIAGLSVGADLWATRGDPETRAFSTFGYRAGKLASVESVNRGGDHLAARRILSAGLSPTPEQVADPAFDLRKLALSVDTRSQ